MKNILRVTSYTLSGLALTLVAVPLIPSAFSMIGLAMQQQRLSTESMLAKNEIDKNESLERFRLNAKAETLDAASRIGEHVKYSQVRVENYTDSVNNPPKLDLSAFKPNERIQVFDRNGVCIGRIRNQRFEWKRHYLNTCLTKTTEDN